MASVTRRPDGRWRARYGDPDGREHARHVTRKTDADRWLATNRADIVRRGYNASLSDTRPRHSHLWPESDDQTARNSTPPSRDRLRTGPATKRSRPGVISVLHY